MYQPPVSAAPVDPIIARLRPRTVGEVLDQINHERVIAPPIAEIEELVVDIAGGLTRDAREVAFRRRATFLAVATRAR